MELPLFHVDAFSRTTFAGNPAAVCKLERWLTPALMQAIAAENNLSETAFFVGSNGRYEIRWFTPTSEIDLCGHATLAAAFTIFSFFEPATTQLVFESRSGRLEVINNGDTLTLDLPAAFGVSQPVPAAIGAALGRQPSEYYYGNEHMAVFDDEAVVAALTPDLALVASLTGIGIIATAPGNEVDFVSRFFAPQIGIPEDPVTGAAHCYLTPYWSRRLNKVSLHAKQLSRRGGELWCEQRGERVLIAGHAVLYLKGSIFVD